MISEIPDKLIVELVGSCLGLSPDTLELTPQESISVVQAYQIESNQGEFILHIGPANDASLVFYEKGMLKQLPDLYELLRSETTIPVPNVVAYDFSLALIDREFIIYEAMSGMPFDRVHTFNHTQYNSVLRQVGDFLRQLHSLTGSDYGYLGPHKPMEPQPTWQDAFDIMWHRLIADVIASHQYTTRETAKLERVWDGYKECFRRDVSASLLRMETWEELILVDQSGNVTGLTGFERAMWGDPEADFAVLDYYGIYASSVWEGYGSPRPTTPESQIRRKFYLLYEIQRHIPANVWHHKNLAEAEQLKQMVLTMVDNLLADL